MLRIWQQKTFVVERQTSICTAPHHVSHAPAAVSERRVRVAPPQPLALLHLLLQLLPLVVPPRLLPLLLLLQQL
jgi:hypothetical protein